MSAAQIIAQLAAASQRLDEAQAKLLAAREDASQARTLVAGALQGGSGQLVGQIDGLVEVLGQVASRPAVTNEQVKQTIAKVQALGN
ncbi:DUF6244 family protein [Micromonospora sp. NPDC049230]|uniref:DUF6244 family protein n=1 Tax=Micromonospora sp. NPDC049230 TaxID=3155502 RepID=UPI00340629C5